MAKYRKRKYPVRNKKRTVAKARKQVRAYPKQIQNANYIAPNRLVKFTDFRSFVVIDNGGTLTSAHPPILQMGLNDPRKFIESVQGQWNKNSLGAKGPGVPGITKWLANKTPGTTSTSDYLTGSTLGCRIVVTVTPIPIADDDQDNFQPICKVALANQTRAGHLKGRGIDLNLNSERISQMPMVRTANIYLNHGGTPRGVTLSMNYSYKKSNADPGKAAGNLFYADTSPTETDIATLIICPGDSNAYGLTGNRCPPCRVEVKISYIVLLTEPNTHLGQAINDGNNLSQPAHIGTQTPAYPLWSHV